MAALAEAGAKGHADDGLLFDRIGGEDGSQGVPRGKLLRPLRPLPPGKDRVMHCKTLLLGFATPSGAHWSLSGEVILMTLLGGMGTFAGPVLGAITVIGLQDMLADRVGSRVTVIIGATFFVCMVAFRRGFVGDLLAWQQRLKGKGKGGWTVPVSSAVQALPSPRGRACAVLGAHPVRLFRATLVVFFRPRSIPPRLWIDPWRWAAMLKWDLQILNSNFNKLY